MHYIMSIINVTMLSKLTKNSALLSTSIAGSPRLLTAKWQGGTQGTFEPSHNRGMNSPPGHTYG